MCVCIYMHACIYEIVHASDPPSKHPAITAALPWMSLEYKYTLLPIAMRRSNSHRYGNTSFTVKLWSNNKAYGMNNEDGD